MAVHEVESALDRQEWLSYRSFDRGSTQTLLAAWRAGTGLCSLDPWLDEYPVSFGIQPGPPDKRATLAVATNAHFISAWRDENETVRLRQPVVSRHIKKRGIAMAG